MEDLIKVIIDSISGEVWDSRRRVTAEKVAKAVEHFNNKWVSVDEKKPEQMQEVLFTNTNLIHGITGEKTRSSVHFGWYRAGSFYSFIDPRDRWRATHWQPLPPPPPIE